MMLIFSKFICLNDIDGENKNDIDKKMTTMDDKHYKLTFFDSRKKAKVKFDEQNVENSDNSENSENSENNEIGMYMCGPTVYNRVHIGNLRTFLFGDIVYRTLKAIGLNIKYVMNITDVDDKIIKLMKRFGLNELLRISRKYEKMFTQNIGQLNMEMPRFHRVSDNMDNIVDLIQQLIYFKFAYRTSDGSVYYDTSKNVDILNYFGISIENNQSTRGK